MIIKEFGHLDNPKFVMLHGGGLSWWSFKPLIEKLAKEYHLLIPVIDGHGEAGEKVFQSIEESALSLMSYLDENFHGEVFAISGFSLGAQIVVEILSQRPRFTQYAILESALVQPMKLPPFLTSKIYSLSYSLIKRKWFAKAQAKALSLPKIMFENYYQDSQKISKESLINLAFSNGSYSLKDTITNFQGKALIIIGEKEIKGIKKSAHLLNKKIKNSDLYIAKGMKHGELSLKNPEKYLRLLSSFLKDKQ